MILQDLISAKTSASTQKLRTRQWWWWRKQWISDVTESLLSRQDSSHKLFEWESSQRHRNVNEYRSQFYQLADAIIVSAAIASYLQHLHEHFYQLVDEIIVSRYCIRLRNLISWINSKTVLSQPPYEMDVTPRKCTKIVTLQEHTAKTYREIPALTGLSLVTVSRVIKSKQGTWSVSLKRKGKWGRKNKNTPRDNGYSLRQSKKDPPKTSDALKSGLEEKCFQISSSTARRRLIAVVRKARRRGKIHLLTKPMKEKRYKWPKKYKDRTKEQWWKVVFSDESLFFAQGQRSQHVRK